MTRGCTIGALSSGSKIMIGVAIAGAAAVTAFIIYKRSKQPGMTTFHVAGAPQQGAQTVAFQPMSAQAY